MSPKRRAKRVTPEEIRKGNVNAFHKKYAAPVSSKKFVELVGAKKATRFIVDVGGENAGKFCSWATPDHAAHFLVQFKNIKDRKNPKNIWNATLFIQHGGIKTAGIFVAHRPDAAYHLVRLLGPRKAAKLVYGKRCYSLPEVVDKFSVRGVVELVERLGAEKVGANLEKLIQQSEKKVPIGEIIAKMKD